MSSITQAKTFLDYLKSTKLFVGIGKVSPWNEGDVLPPDSDLYPNAGVSAFNDAVFFKETYPGDFTTAARRITWEDGKVFDQWNQADQELREKDFYCINEYGNVYVCLKSPGEPSTVQPDTVSPDVFSTADGYTWKLIACVPEPIDLKFGNQEYMPIKTLESSEVGYEVQYAAQSAAVGGTIDRVDIVQPGKRYSSSVQAYIIGDGTGAKITLDLHNITGEITGVSVDESGRGYTYADVKIIDPSPIGGTDGILNAIVSPLNGHGSDPATELFADTIIGSILIEQDESGFLPGDFDFREVFLTSDIEAAEGYPLEFLPRGGYILINDTIDFTFKIRHNIAGASILEFLKEGDTDRIVLAADPADPYNGKESEINALGYTVSYDATSRVWEIKCIDAPEKIYFEIKDTSGTVLFGDIDNPFQDCTLEYSFYVDPTLTNDVQDFQETTLTPAGRYSYCVDLELSGESGTFVSGESISFLNGGSATVVFVDNNLLRVSSIRNIMFGSITGSISGATANVVNISNRPFALSNDVVYMHHFNKTTKLKESNIKIIPVFKFPN